MRFFDPQQKSRDASTEPPKTPHHDGIHRRAQADHAQRVVLAALHLVLALLPHGPRQPFAPRVVGLGRHRGDARGLVLFPVAALAGLATVVGDLALRASAQRRAPALLAAVEAGEQVDPLDERFCWAQLLGLVGLLVGGRALWFCGREGRCGGSD